jgi:hypothetical protein
MLRVRYPATFAAERRYVVDVLLGEFLGLDCIHEEAAIDGFEISLAENPGAGRVVLADGLFAQGDRERLSIAVLPREPLKLWDLAGSGVDASVVSQELPVIYGSAPYLELAEDEVRLGLDVFGSSFFMLARLEEAIRTERDVHDRLPASESLAAKEGFLERPIVNEYLEILWWAIRRVWPSLQRRPRELRVLPTHDVDYPFCSRTSLKVLARRAAKDVVRTKDPLLALARVRAFVTSAYRGPSSDLCNTFDFIMRACERRGLTGAFYFIAGRTDPRFDTDYAIESPEVRQLIGDIARRGHEIGLHPSYGTYQDVGRLRAELATLRRVSLEEGVDQREWGGRQHFLRWSNPETWAAWDEAGLDYDSTLGFAAASGFRCGTCYEYPAFDVVSRTPLRLRERPLLLMEGTLTQYQNRDIAEILEPARLLKERCRLFGGDFTFLWHNNWLARRTERKAYEAVLDV